MKYYNVFLNREIQEKYRKRDKVLPDTIVKVFGDNVKVNVIPKETKLVCKYNIVDISLPSVLRTNYEPNMFKSMEIDGVLLDNLVTTYLFDTPGEHIVKYELYDETKVGNNAPLFGVGTLTNIFIPDSVTTIGASAFNNCTGLTSIGSAGSGASLEISNSVTSIGVAAFYGCTGLTSVTISSNVTFIGDAIFIGCKNIETFNYNSPVELDVRFTQTGKFRSVIIGDVTTSIGSAAFQGKTTLENVIIGNNVTTIGVSAFKSCTSLTDVTIGNNVTTIGTESFNLCTSLINITIPDSVTYIGDRAFIGSNLTNITMSNNINSIGSAAFAQTNIVSINITSNRRAVIGQNVFAGCVNLENVSIGNNIITIGSSAFRGCTKLTNISIGNDVDTIDDNAFNGCTSLTNVTIPESVTDISGAVFLGCTSLVNITVLSITPPSLKGLTHFERNAEGRKIYVPSESLNTYKTATGWVLYANDIEPIP